MNDDPLDTDVLVVVTSRDRVDEDTPTGLWLEEFAVPYDVERDGRVITGQNPQSSASAARELALALQEAKTAGAGGRP